MSITKVINLVQKVQGNNDASSAQMVTVRQGYSSVPTHFNECGLGGTGEKETKPNNVTYIRFGPDFLSIPEGAIINSAVLNWEVVGCDWRCGINNVMVTPCSNFSSNITGKNVPVSYNTSISSVFIPQLSYTSGYLTNNKGRENGRKVRPQALSWDISTTVRYMVKNRLNCVKVSVAAGKNRKYLSSSASILISYVAAPEYCNLSTLNTDCTNSAYFEDSVNVSASSPTNSGTPYFKFTFTSGSNVFNTAWSANSSFTFSEIQAFGSNSNNNLTVVCRASYDITGATSVISNTLTINKNLAPLVSPPVFTSSQNMLFVKNLKTYGYGVVNFTCNVVDAALKSGFNSGAVDKSYFLSVFEGEVPGAQVKIGDTSIGITNNRSKRLRLYCSAHDGFKSASNYSEIYSDSLPYVYNVRAYTAQGNITTDRLPAGTLVSFECTFKHDQGLNNLLKVMRYKKTGEQGQFVLDNTVSRTVSPTDIGADSYSLTLTDSITTPSSTTEYVEYKWVYESTDLVKQVLTGSSQYKVNRIPSTTSGLTVVGITYKNYVNTTIQNGIPVHTLITEGSFSDSMASFRDNLNLDWDTSSDADGDSLNYIIKENDSTIYQGPGLSHVDTNLSTPGTNRTYTVYSSDGFNTVTGQSKVIALNDTPVVPSGVTIQEYNYTSNLYENYNYIEGSINRIGNKVKILWSAISNFVTPSGAMRYCVEVWKHNGIELIKEYGFITDLAATSGVLDLNIAYTSTTRIKFRVYAIDRFNEYGAIYESGFFYLKQSVFVPQLMGIKGGMTIWNPGLWNNQSIISGSHLKKPVFFANFKNPDQSSNLNVVVRLFPKIHNGTDIKNIIPNINGFPNTPDGLILYLSSLSQTYNVHTLTASAAYVGPNINYSYKPFEEKIIAFKVTDDTYLEIGKQYYVITRLELGSSGVYVYNDLNENVQISYSVSYNGFYPANLIADQSTILRTQVQTIQNYVSNLYVSYGFETPFIGDLDEFIIATDDTSTVGRPVQGLFDYEVAEPQNYNLCPYPDFYLDYSSYWYDRTANVSINNKSLVFTGEGSARSLYLPWDYANVNQLWVGFDLETTVGDTLDLRKYINYGVEFYDANKTLLDSINISTPLLLVNDENGTVNTLKFTLNDVFDLDSGTFQKDVKFIKLKIYTEPQGTQYFLGDFKISNILVYKGTSNTEYIMSPYIEYVDDFIGDNLDISCGSFNSWVSRLGYLLHSLINTKLYNVLASSGLAAQDITDDWLTVDTTITLPTVTELDYVTLNDFHNIVFSENGLWGYQLRF